MANKILITTVIETETTCASFLSKGDLGALISAALVDQALCELLLTNPREAFEFTYGTESFNLSPNEKELLLSVKTPTSLADLAQQVTKNYADSQRNK